MPLALRIAALAAPCLLAGAWAAAADDGERLPWATWRDLYSEAYGWSRTSGARLTSDAVPTLRLRAGIRAPIELDLGPYVYAQATRDVASRGPGGGAPPQLYADHYALLGAGARLRLWGGRLGLFLQAGPAFALVEPGDGRRSVALDARGGATLGLETSRCWPAAADLAESGPLPCGELYSEVVYLSRFADEVVGLLRGRAAVTLVVLGPWALQLAAEARVAVDRNHDYYANLADAGVGPRFRLLRPFHLDVFPTFSAGTYLGPEGRDPAPRPLSYAEIRLQVATGLEF